MGRLKINSPDKWPDLDRALFTRGCERSSRRTDKRSPRTLAAKTIKGIVQDYSVSLRWYDATHGLVLNTIPTSRWTYDILAHMVDELFDEGKSAATILTRVQRTKRTISIMDPSANLCMFDQIAAGIGPPRPQKKDPRILNITSWDLQELGISLMDRAVAMDEWSLLRRAFLYQTGAQVALLSARPWRSRAFFSMLVESSIDQAGELYRIAALSQVTKHRRRQSGIVPSRLQPYLKVFLSDWRPVLCQNQYTRGALWLNMDAKPQTQDEFRKECKAATLKRFEFSITPQLIRCIAATTLAVHNPRRVNCIEGVLGQVGPQVGEIHYNQANSVFGFEKLGDTMDDLSNVARDRRRLGNVKRRS